MIKVIKIDSGQEVVGSEKSRFSLNLSTMAIYHRGTNVSPQYKIIGGVNNIEKQIDKSKHRNQDLVFDLIWKNMAKLKGGSLKAMLVILNKTVLSNRRSAVITNEQFIEFGEHLTRRDYVAKATDRLVELGMIIKHQHDAYCFKYTPNIER